MPKRKDTGVEEQHALPKAKLPSLSTYRDYRQYLSEVIASECGSRPGLSLATFAKAFGMSRSALSMILNGARPLTLPHIHRIAAALRLDHADHTFFEAMVLMCQAESKDDRAYYERKLESHRMERGPQTVIAASRSLISEWFVPAILVYLIDVSNADDAQAEIPRLSAKLGIREEQVREVIAQLESEGFLSFKGRGNVHITFNRVAAMISSQQFIKAASTEAIRQMSRHFDSPLHFFGFHTFSIRESEISTFIEEYKGLVNKYLTSAATDDKRDELRVIQVTSQLLSVF